MKTKLLIALFLLLLPVGCSSSETKNIATDASQEELDRYNELIEKEAKQVSESAEEDDI